MPGKAVGREEKELTSRVNVVNSETSVQTVQGKYSGSGSDRKTIIAGQSEMRPYNYFKVLEGRVGDLKALQGAVADIIVEGKYPVASLVADLNHGMEYRGRESWRDGIDPSTTENQRKRLNDFRGLINDGIMSLEEHAIPALMRIGLTEEQIRAALG